MITAKITPQQRVTKQITPTINASSLFCFIGIASNYKSIKRYCIDSFGHHLTLNGYWCLLLLGCFGRVGVTSFGLHTLFNISFNTVVLRNTQRLLFVLVSCGLVIRSKNGNSVMYSLSFQAEKLIFSGIDKSALLELSAMVKGIQDEERKASKVAKGKRSAKVAK